LTVLPSQSKPNRFIDTEAPELPPLADPELFEAVFFENFSSSKFMPHYGDALLKAITFDVLSEILGKDDFKTISNITPLAISNAFYEQIVLHYGLEKLTLCNKPAHAKPSWARTHWRGDLLEAYMAAIEKDFSREGQGYREVREWLFKVLALRLRTGIQDETALRSNGTERQSFTLLCSPSSLVGTSITNFGAKVMDSNTSALKPSTLTSTMDKAASSKAMDIWQHGDRQTALETITKGNHFSMKDSNLSLNIQLDHFRQFVFDLMKQILQDLQTAGSWDVKNFWNALSAHLSQLQSMLQDEGEKILLLYYRVSHR
jgi:hypothetical protein